MAISPEKQQSPTEQLMQAGREFSQRGWVLGTSGNFSLLLARKPMRLIITSGDNEKGSLDETNFLELDDNAEILQGFGKLSAETYLHLTLYRLLPKARSVLHTHSVWGTILSDLYFQDGSIDFEGYEILKGIAGVDTHEHKETIPIVENSEDHLALAHVIDNVIRENPNIHGIFLRRHGLYTWGSDVLQAKRHVEILEFLMEVAGRRLTIQH